MLLLASACTKHDREVPGPNERFVLRVSPPRVPWPHAIRKPEKYRTVSLVSHDPSFCCDGPTEEINASLESSWSTKLKSITFDPNRAIFDEQEQVIDSAARSLNRFL